MNTRQNAFKIYQFMKDAGIDKVSGNIIRQYIEQILGTYDYRQKVLILRCMVQEGWLTEIGNEGRFNLRQFTVNPDGELLSPDEKIKQMLKEMGK